VTQLSAFQITDRLVSFYQRLASKLYHSKRYFFAFTWASFGSMAIINFFPTRSFGKPIPIFGDNEILCMLGITWFWGLVCLCDWFHPKHGSLYKENSRVDKLNKPSPGSAAIFLTFWFVGVPMLLLFYSL
jgi:hypothetical protein